MLELAEVGLYRKQGSPGLRGTVSKVLIMAEVARHRQLDGRRGPLAGPDPSGRSP
ncbi:MAG TPA: hypothetical protein VK995_06395 [Oceanipulchritudo sp.]|nr:hypothetical protein [Oceanipulchritudo sp.]